MQSVSRAQFILLDVQSCPGEHYYSDLYFYFFLRDNTIEYRKNKSIRSPLKILLTMNKGMLGQGKYLKLSWHKFCQSHK